MNRYQILIEYVGTNFRGWQIQKKGQTIQGLIQEKLSKLLKEKIVLHGQGRTDAGVHAFEQSAHFDCKNKIVDTIKFLKSINHFLNLKLFLKLHWLVVSPLHQPLEKKSLPFHNYFLLKADQA